MVNVASGSAVKIIIAALMALSLQASWAAKRPSSECAVLVRASLAKANLRIDQAAKKDPDGFWSVAKSQMGKANATPWETMSVEQVEKINPVVKKEQTKVVVDIAKLADKRAVAKSIAEGAKASGSVEDVAKSQKAQRLLADYSLFYEIRREVLKSQADYVACVGG